MKRLFLISAVLTSLLTSCSINGMWEVTPAAGEAITFMTANYATKVGISGTQFPMTQSFGAYAWSDGRIFMNDETVSYQTDAWKPSTTYYWQKNKTVDFVCYYPAHMNEISVTPNSIAYTNYDVEHNQQDIMYADKAAGYADQVDIDGLEYVSVGQNGVPTLFRHALSKLTIKMSLGYASKLEEDGTNTRWEVKVNSATLEGVYAKGNCNLVLASQPKIGIINWLKPADANGHYVWTPDGTLIQPVDITPQVHTLGTEEITLLPEQFVLPQSLEAGQQRIKLNISIRTIRNGEQFLTETYDTTSSLLLPKNLEAWQMSQSITYHIKLSPLASNGNGGRPEDPDHPVDPDNPDLTDIAMTFDPAVDGWEDVTVKATILL